ncbi:MAG: RHS repeat-associated core domain-containing protein [Luteolibacter sp.]
MFSIKNSLFGSKLQSALAGVFALALIPVHSAGAAGCACGSGETVDLEFKGSVNKLHGKDGEVSIAVLTGMTRSEDETEPAEGAIGPANTKELGKAKLPTEKKQSNGTSEPVETTVSVNVNPGGTSDDWNIQSYCDGGEVTCSFELKNACGWELQISTPSAISSSGWSEWKTATTVTLHYHIPNVVEPLDFKIRLKKEAANGSSGGSGGNNNSAGEAASNSSPSISEETQDAPPASGGLPQGLSPAYFQSTVALKSRTSTVPEDEETRAGSIMLKGAISPTIATASQLEVFLASGQDPAQFNMVMESGAFRQVKTPGHLADIQPVSGGGVEIRQYEDGQFNPVPPGGAGTVYTVYSGQTAPNIVRYTPITAAGDHSGGVRVTTIAANGVTHIRDVVSTSADGLTWRVIQDGLETRDLVSVFTYDSGVWERTDQESVTRDGNLVSKSTKIYRYLVRRDGSPSVVVESVEYLREERELVDTVSGEELVTTHVADSDFPDRDKYVIRPDGSWVAYNYYTGSEIGGYLEWRGLMKETLRPFGGAITDPAVATAANSESTITTYYVPDAYLSSYEVKGQETSLPTSGIVRKWERSYSDASSYSLFYLLESAGYSSDWSSALQGKIRDDSRLDYASSGETIKSSSLSIETRDDSFPLLNGRSFASIDAEGKGTVTGYEQGGFVASSGVFTPDSDPANATGNFIRSTTLAVANYTELPNPLEATKTVTIEDLKGRPYRKELWILDGSSAWSLATVSTFEYPTWFGDGRPSETIEKQDGRVISDTTYSGNTEIIVDEQGIKTTTVQDLLGRTASVTREGYGTQPDIVTSYAYNSLTTTSTETAGSLSRTSVRVVDLAGRTTSETDPSNAVTGTTYPNGGRDTWTNLPGGLTRKAIGRIDGRTDSIIGTAVVPEFYTYAPVASGLNVGNMATTKFLGTSTSARYIVTEQDWAGREVRETSPSPVGTGEVSTQYTYVSNTKSMASGSSPSGTILYTRPDLYSSTTLAGYDVDGGGLATGGTDRVAESNQSYANVSGYWWQVSTRKNYDVNGSSASAITTASKRCLHGNPGGFASWTISSASVTGTVESKTSIDRNSKTLTQTEISSAASVNAISVNINGLLDSQKGHDSTNPTRWVYNALGQPLKQVSPRGEISLKSYNADGSLATTTDHSGKVTSYLYYGPTSASAGKLQQITNPLSKTTTYTYSDLGQVTAEAGTATYKVTYEYDAYGAKKKMFTWRDATTSDVTEWVYQDGTGLLLSKKDAAAQHTDYTYYATGKMATRTWSRGVSATYSYGTYGDLIGINYSDSTPDVDLTALDRLGRPATIKQGGVIVEQLTYHAGIGAVNARYNAFTNPQLPGLGIRYNAPDSSGRSVGFMETSGSNATVVRTVGYSYDASGRFDTLTDGSQNHVYAYHPNSSLISTINSRSGSTSWFRESRYYDTRSRLTGIRSDRMSGTSLMAEISAHGYDYDDLSRRTKNTFQDGSRWEYGYDDLSQVTSAARKNAAGTDIPQLGASYSYDGIGNRLTSNSPVLGNHTYTPNSLNQYASITTSTDRTAVGRAPAAWTVQVAGVNASRIGEIYYRDLTATNSTVPVWQSVITKRDTGTPTTTNNFWYAKTPTVPTYDLDGNLTDDGRWVYTWDAENCLIQMETTTAATTAGHPYTKLKFVYDWQGHRIARTVWQGGTQAAPTFKSNRRWIYDGWNVIAEFSATTETTTTVTRLNTFTWGLDLSGTLQGAGGVGGLLVQTTVSGPVIERTSYDGNGNIVAWTKSTTSAPTSRREYDAFGNTPVSEGAAPCSFGFSTKMQDVETGLYYYGYRFYDPATGRWSSKDPIGESGGFNLYGFVNNSGTGAVDMLGMACIKNIVVLLSSNNDGTQPDLHPRPDQLYNHKTGRVFYGTMSVAYEDDTIRVFPIHDGGYRTIGSAIDGPSESNPRGDDSVTPPGSGSVSTKQNDYGLRGFPIAITGMTCRGGILIHDSAGKIGTHGCVGVTSGFQSFASDMKDTRVQGQKSKVPISVNYDGDQPVGAFGHGVSTL